MKPVSIRISAFGPYLKEQFIDFSDLTSAGIFLISGETGSGKTVILDAMTYALYGKSSGGGRGDIFAMRCTGASEEDETVVEYVFDIHQKRYKFIRTLKYGRKNLNAQQNVLVMNSDGVYEPIFENPKQSDLERTAEELLGLTYEQFRQVIILPQGQFEQLLTSNSKDKEKILTSLFNTEKWDSAAKILYSEAAERMKSVKDERNAVEAVLSENGCSSLEELCGLYEEKSSQLCETEKTLKGFSDELEKIRKNARTAEKIADKFVRLEKNEDEYRKLTENDEKIKEKEELLLKARNAEKARTAYNALMSARDGKKMRAEKSENAEKAAEICKKSLDCAINEQKKLDGEKSVYAEKEKQISALCDMTEVYRRADLLQKDLKSAEKSAKTAEEYALKKKTEKSAADEYAKSLENVKAELYKEYSSAVGKYTAALCASLAEGLSDGTPCPVCGSTSHPSKAVPTAETVTEDMLKELQKKIELNNSETDLAENKRKKITAELEKANSDYIEKKTAAEKLKTEYDTVTEKTDKSIGSEEELALKIGVLKTETEKFAKKTAAAAENVKALSEEFAVKASAAKTAAEEVKSAEKAEKSAEKEFFAVLKKHGFADEKDFIGALISEKEREMTEKSVSEHKINKESALKNIDELKAELNGTEKPDTEKILSQLNDAEENNKNLVAAHALAESETKRLKKLCTSVKKQTAALKKKGEKAEEDILFAKRLRGDNGISLQRYMLGIMLSSVITSANRLLENVHGGRYKLYRSDESSGSSRIKGLEFSVYDRFSAKNRPVTTLSGGEKFLAALSLSIGLSSVIRTQSGGIEMGAMFIDEGFGTLDSASVSDALSILGTMKRSDAVIGIISHVGILKENIAAGIEITKTEKGSSLKVKSR